MTANVSSEGEPSVSSPPVINLTEQDAHGDPALTGEFEAESMPQPLPVDALQSEPETTPASESKPAADPVVGTEPETRPDALGVAGSETSSSAASTDEDELAYDEWLLGTKIPSTGDGLEEGDDNKALADEGQEEDTVPIPLGKNPEDDETDDTSGSDPVLVAAPVAAVTKRRLARPPVARVDGPIRSQRKGLGIGNFLRNRNTIAFGLGATALALLTWRGGWHEIPGLLRSAWEWANNSEHHATVSAIAGKSQQVATNVNPGEAAGTVGTAVGTAPAVHEATTYTAAIESWANGAFDAATKSTQGSFQDTMVTLIQKAGLNLKTGSPEYREFALSQLRKVPEAILGFDPSTASDAQLLKAADNLPTGLTFSVTT